MQPAKKFEPLSLLSSGTQKMRQAANDVAEALAGLRGIVAVQTAPSHLDEFSRAFCDLSRLNYELNQVLGRYGPGDRSRTPTSREGRKLLDEKMEGFCKSQGLEREDLNPDDFCDWFCGEYPFPGVPGSSERKIWDYVDERMVSRSRSRSTSVKEPRVQLRILVAELTPTKVNVPPPPHIE